LDWIKYAGGNNFNAILNNGISYLISWELIFYHSILEDSMSYFSTEKKINISISAIYTQGIQTILGAYEDVNIFIPSAVPTTVQMASSIGYPTVTTDASPPTITLEAGWKYLIELKMKITDPSASASENFQYIATDTSNNQISSTGSIAVYRDSAYAYAQEKCIFYADSSSASTVFKIQAAKIGGGAGGGLNVSQLAGNTNFRCHILIKAWK
jgi:hypothetical protein